MSYMKLTSKCNNLHGTSLTVIDSQRTLVTRPGFQYAEGGWAIMDNQGFLYQNSTPIDLYYQQHSNELPKNIQSLCIRNGKQDNLCINRYMQENYDHSHLGMSSVRYS